MNTTDEAWYTTACVPFLTIQGCTPGERQAYITWGALLMAADIAAFIFLSAALIRRYLLVDEPFNTIRMVLIKLLLSIPLCVKLHFTWDVIRATGGDSQHGVSALAMCSMTFISFVPGFMGLIMLITTWVSFSRETLAARPVIVGNTKLYLAITVPLVVVSTVCGVCGGLSHPAYNVCIRMFYATWAVLLFALTSLILVYGWNNIQRLEQAEDSFHRNQLIRMTVVLAVLFTNAAFVCILDSIFLTSIDASMTWFLLFQACYRLSFWIVLMGGAIYAWVATTVRVEVISSKRSTGLHSGRTTRDRTHSTSQALASVSASRNGNSRDDSERSPNSNKLQLPASGSWQPHMASNPVTP